MAINISGKQRWRPSESPSWVYSIIYCIRENGLIAVQAKYRNLLHMHSLNLQLLVLSCKLQAGNVVIVFSLERLIWGKDLWMLVLDSPLEGSNAMFLCLEYELQFVVWHFVFSNVFLFLKIWKLDLHVSFWFRKMYCYYKFASTLECSGPLYQHFFHIFPVYIVIFHGDLGSYSSTSCHSRV